MHTYKARAIVLHTVKYGENAVVAYILTDTVGRQAYIVQGVKSTRGKGGKMALLQPLTPLELVGLSSPRMQLHRIREMAIPAGFRPVATDMRKSTISLFLAEVLYRLVRETEPDSPLFTFVWDAVVVFGNMTEGVSNFHLWFIVHLSRYLGFFPGNEYVKGMWFDLQEGMFTAVQPQHGMWLDRELSLLVNDLIQLPVEESHRIRMSREQRSAMINALMKYFAYHFDSVNRIRSVDILRELF